MVEDTPNAAPATPIEAARSEYSIPVAGKSTVRSPLYCSIAAEAGLRKQNGRGLMPAAAKCKSG